MLHHTLARRVVLLGAFAVVVALRTFVVGELGVSASGPPGVDPTGLIGTWHLDGNAEDASGQQHHGTVVGSGVTVIPDGIAGPAFRFDGNGAIDVGNLDFSNEKYTVSIWIRTLDTAGVDLFRMAIGKGLTTGDMTFELFLGDGQAGGRNDAGYIVWDAWQSRVQINPARPGVSLRDGRWHMLTATYTNGAQRLY